MRNPCGSCRLIKQNKNNPVCENCEKRLAYLRFLSDDTGPNIPVTSASKFKDKPRPKPIYKTPAPPPTCKHPGCTNKICARGLCRKHYNRILSLEKRSGVKREPPREWGNTCIWSGCDQLAISCGLCNSHYHKRRDKTLFKNIHLQLASIIELNKIAEKTGIEPVDVLQRLVVLGLKFYRERSAV